MVFLANAVVCSLGGAAAYFAGERELSDAALVVAMVFCLCCVAAIVRAQVLRRREEVGTKE